MIIKCIVSLAAIVIACHSPAEVVRSMLGARGAIMSAGAWKNPYITDGLVAMWDGEWNAGGGKHDASATVWKDLMGDLDAAAVDNPVFGDDHTATSNGYWSLPSSVREIVETQSLTAEVVFSALYNNYTHNQGIIGIGDRRSLWLYFGKPPANVGASIDWQVRRSSAIRVWYNMGVFGTEVHSSSVVVDNSVCNAYLDSTLCTITPNVSAGSSTSPSGFFIGKMSGFANFNGKIHTIRLYTRALTASEIAQNYAVDKARFNLP